MTDIIDKTDEDWKKELTPQQYQVLREKGTEAPFSGEYVHPKEDGMFKCAACGLELFDSQTQYDSGSGWPSFYQPLEGKVEERPDMDGGLERTEVLCKRCQSHLGHVFNDGPNPTGLRYCMNSCALKLDKEDK